ncbi:MAG: hypothetical protein KGL12_07620 [Rhodospirillales bacterium]|nr:hypothetical protein [Rhodospirillales bacterium]
MEAQTTLIIGGGPAGRAAAATLPDAMLLTRPGVTVWHAEPGRVWVEDAAGVRALPFTRLLLCADEPLLIAALGGDCVGGRVRTDATGATSLPGVFAAGRILGASTAEEAARQGRIAAQALAGLPCEGRIDILPAIPQAVPARLDPLDLAHLLTMPPGPARSRAALAQRAARGPGLAGVIAPARPVGLAALAAFAPAQLKPRPMQREDQP